MKIGAHISAAGGVQNAPLNAHKLGCECYQFFSRSPQGGKVPKLSNKIIKEFKENNKKFNFKNYYIHAPYFINLCSTNNRIYYGSISAIRKELERGSQLKAKGVMFHLGSAKDLSRKKAISKAIKGVSEILKNYSGSCELFLENSAGSGNVIGDSFEELAEIINSQSKTNQKKIGICFDTCHAFASGYDLRDKKSISKTFNQFNNIIGLKKLKVIHINDSKTDLGSHRDRHEHIGKGKIGLDGFKILLRNPKLKNINLILETPGDSGREKDLKILKNL